LSFWGLLSQYYFAATLDRSCEDVDSDLEELTWGPGVEERSDTVDGRSPAPVNGSYRWFIPLFIGFQHVSSIQDGAGFRNHPQYVPSLQRFH
jgi:hypothetical protein